MAISACENFFRSINMPVTVKELGYELNDNMISELAEKCSHFGKRTIGGFKILDKQDMINIYNSAK